MYVLIVLIDNRMVMNVMKHIPVVKQWYENMSSENKKDFQYIVSTVGSDNIKLAESVLEAPSQLLLNLYLITRGVIPGNFHTIPYIYHY